MVPTRTRRRVVGTLRRVADEPWQDLLDTAPDAMLLVGPRGRIALVNRQLETMFGYERGELVGEPIEMLVPERFRQRHVDHRDGFFADPNLRPMGAGLSLHGLRKDGSELAVEVSLSPIEHEVGLVVSAAIRDATDRVETERRLRELDLLKDEFLSVVSHELRTPLTAISGFAQLLLNRADLIDDDTRVDLLARIARNAGEMDHLVGQLLDLSRLDAGRIDMHPAPICLLEAVRTCIASLATHVAARVSVEMTESIVVLADPHALDRVLSNLVTNGVKFSPEDRPVRIEVSTDDATAVVTVTDEGVGIPLDEQDKVFDRFYQIGSGIRAPRHGTGIGLSIVRHYIELLGGQVWVESAPGLGSAFSFSLPRG